MTAYSVSGTLSPDVSGTYSDAGEINGYPYYSRDAGGPWYISFIGILGTNWVISGTPGNLGAGAGWRCDGAEIAGDYLAYVEPATGTATVAEVSTDDTPDEFDFTDVADADPSTVYMSDEQVITGMDAGTAISIVGGEYRLNDGSWTSDPGTIDPDDELELRATSSANTGAPRSNRQTTVTVTVGSVEVDWVITTAFLSQTFALKSVEVDGGTFVVRTTDIED